MTLLKNSRKWSTPATIGSGVFVAVSGVLMFYGIHNPIALAHEWIGLLFAAAILFHSANHWTSLKKYFSQTMAITVLGTIMLVTVSLLVLSATEEGGGGVMSIIHKVEEAPLAEVSLILDKSTKDVVSSLKKEGYVVLDSSQSIYDISVANKVHPKELSAILFR